MTNTRSNPYSRKHSHKDKKILEGALLLQGGRAVFLTAALASLVTKQAHIDTFDAEKQDGYQRELAEARVSRAVEFYKEGGVMPNPLLVNIRKKDYAKVRLSLGDHDQDVKRALKEESHWIGAATLAIPAGVTLWIFDGQHRVAAVKQLVVDDPAFGAFPVPLSITLGLRAYEEMKAFYDVNTNAKPVPTDLAWQLLKQQAAADPQIAASLDLKGRDWQMRGIEVLNELRKIQGPWQDTVQRANEKRRRADRLAIKETQFIRSLRPVLTMTLLADQDPGTVARMIDAYWKGIALVLPDPFSPESNPKQWVIQKGPGVWAFHSIMPQAIEMVRSDGDGLGDPAAYAAVLARVGELQGEAFDADGAPTTVSGAQFWASGPTGVASQFTGDSGRRGLARRLKTLLPDEARAIKL